MKIPFFTWKSTKPKFTPRVLKVPEEHTVELLTLLDNADIQQTNLNKYYLWHRLEELFPEIKEGNTSWRIYTKRSTQFCIEEFEKENK